MTLDACPEFEMSWTTRRKEYNTQTKSKKKLKIKFLINLDCIIINWISLLIRWTEEWKKIERVRDLINSSNSIKKIIRHTNNLFSLTLFKVIAVPVLFSANSVRVIHTHAHRQEKFWHGLKKKWHGRRWKLIKRLQTLFFS